MWIIQEDSSHEIVSCNVHEKDGIFQLWVTRPNDKSLKIMESDKEDVILEIKEAIDFAVIHGQNALELK